MKALLIILVVIIATASTASGLLMISEPGGGLLGLTPGLLEGTPFRDFTIPGVLLIGVVGGVAIITIYAVISQSTRCYTWSMICGFVTIGWLSGQVIFIDSISWMQFVIFLVSVLIILISYQLRGKWAV